MFWWSAISHLSVMRKRRVILAALGLATAGGLLARLLWYPQCPVEARVAALEPSGMLNDGGVELLMVTLNVSNRDRVAVMFEDARGFEARSARGDWVPVKCSFTVPRIDPGRQASVLLLAPPGSTACRLHLRYQTQIWKCRVIESLGVWGRTLVAKSPVLCKLLWPDELKTMPVPPHWRRRTIEVLFPTDTTSPSGGMHSHTIQRMGESSTVCYPVDVRQV
jgi:hypothetical protein